MSVEPDTPAGRAVRSRAAPGPSAGRAHHGEAGGGVAPLPGGRERGVRPARRRPRGRSGRVRGGAGPVGQRQVDAAQHHRRPRHPDRQAGPWSPAGRSPTWTRASCSASDARWCRSSSRRSTCSPPSPRSRTCSAAPRSPARPRRPATAREVLDQVGLSERLAPLPERAVRRGAAAGGHRPSAGHRQPAAGRRRTHRRPGLPHRRADPAAAARAGRGRPHRHRRHPQPGDLPGGRPGRRAVERSGGQRRPALRSGGPRSATCTGSRPPPWASCSRSDGPRGTCGGVGPRCW